MKSGDKLKVKLLLGEVVEAIYVRPSESGYGVDSHLLVAVKPLPPAYTTKEHNKALVAIVGREPSYWWECSIVEPVAVQS